MTHGVGVFCATLPFLGVASCISVTSYTSFLVRQLPHRAGISIACSVRERHTRSTFAMHYGLVSTSNEEN